MRPNASRKRRVYGTQCLAHMFPCQMRSHVKRGHMSNERGGVRGTTFPAHPPAHVLGAEVVGAAALDGAVRLRINDALDAGTQLNCARAVHAGSGGVQFAVRCGAHNVERDALTSFLCLLLMFIDFFYGAHFGVAAPPNGGRCAARGVKAARHHLAVHDRNAPVLHAN